MINMQLPRQITEQSQRRARRQRRRGVATVEFAVVAPVILVLLLGTVDVGQLVNVGQTVSNASREGARTAVRRTTQSASEVNAAVSSYLEGCYPGIPEATLDAAYEVIVANGYGYPITDLTAVPTGSSLSVQIVFNFNSVRWLNGVGFLDNKTLGTTTVMRRE